MKGVFFVLFWMVNHLLCGQVELGVDRFFKEGHDKKLKGKKIGLITNHTGINREGISTVTLLKTQAKDFSLVALFCPEHGLQGNAYAGEKIEHERKADQLPIYSLHGETRRPTSQMLQTIDVLIYDIQDIGVRSYTYATTLFYVMEKAAKMGIEVIVFDRPNPMNGLLVDGPMLEEKWRSYIGYINVPYCHGMTIGELARLFNAEYKIGCNLTVIPMKGWKREMTFQQTHLLWIPTSPHIPEADTPLFYASTGMLGELDIVNIGIGYTLPFKTVGAPWIHAETFAMKLNARKLSGVYFVPFHYRPFYGSFQGQECHGVLIRITDPATYSPLSVQFLLMGMLKNLYSKEVEEALFKVNFGKKTLFCKASGSGELYRIFKGERDGIEKMIFFQQEEREKFKKTRKKYLIPAYT